MPRWLPAAGACAIVSLWLSAGIAQAANIAVNAQTRSAFDCDISLSGPIRSGDAARLERLLPQIGDREHRTICLSSTGGDYNEGIALAELVRSSALTTRLVAGARCFSSCAIAFMGGGWDSGGGEGVFSHRLMSPRSQLGFHAPYLRIGENDFTQENVRGAYRQATRSIGRLLAATLRIDFDLPLVREMLYRGQDELFLIDTVGLLGLYGIGLHGYAAMEEYKGQEFHSCWNYYSWKNGKNVIDYYRSWHEDSDDGELYRIIDGDFRNYVERPEDFREEGGDFLLTPGDFSINCSIEYGSADSSYLGVPTQQDVYDEVDGPRIDGEDASLNYGLMPAWARLDARTRLEDIPAGPLIDLALGMWYRFPRADAD